MDFLSAIGHLLNIGQQHPQAKPQSPILHDKPTNSGLQYNSPITHQTQSVPVGDPSLNQQYQSNDPRLIPVGQPIPQSFMDSYSPQTRALAQIYNQNPQDPRVAHVDPAMFGYAADNTAAPQSGLNVHSPQPATSYPATPKAPQSFLSQLLNFKVK